MTKPRYDLFVIGAGSGGVRAARIAASHGARVAIAEASRIGGTCVIRGCVPKKLYVLASRFKDAFEDAQGFGWSLAAAPRFDWKALVDAKNREITRLEGLYRQGLEKSGVEIVAARAVLVGPQEVAFADGRHVQASHILIAVGGAPAPILEIPGVELAISSNEIFDLEEFPRRLLVVGSGYIAVEFASLFARLGAQTTMAFRAETPLRGFDDDLRRRLAAALAASGVTLAPRTLPTRLRRTASGIAASLASGEEIEADVVLFATGRRPATRGLGLEPLGVALRQNGAIVVDAAQRSSVPSIYAVGDVTDRINLTPVAIREGHAFADRVFGGRDVAVDYEFTPSAVFSTPELGTVGLSEAEAVEKYGAVAVFETAFRPMQATLSGRAEQVYMKLLVDEATDQVLGAHILGREAAEMAQVAAIALKMRATKADFDATMALHPTLAEELVTMRTPARTAHSAVRAAESASAPVRSLGAAR
ncbi:MAG TPA: glutathione-disulfide reductase [Methylocystis sp.]|nr:glutathione-disulfide reductase [Methylocystis sp.]